TTISVEVQELVNAGVLVEGEKVKDKKTGRIAQSYQLDDEFIFMYTHDFEGGREALENLASLDGMNAYRIPADKKEEVYRAIAKHLYGESDMIGNPIDTDMYVVGALARSGEYGQAIALAKKAREQEDRSQRLDAIVKIMLGKGNYEAARRTLREGVENNKEISLAAGNVIIAHVKEGLYEEAEKILELMRDDHWKESATRIIRNYRLASRVRTKAATNDSSQVKVSISRARLNSVSDIESSGRQIADIARSTIVQLYQSGEIGLAKRVFSLISYHMWRNDLSGVDVIDAEIDEDYDGVWKYDWSLGDIIEDDIIEEYVDGLMQDAHAVIPGEILKLDDVGDEEPISVDKLVKILFSEDFPEGLQTTGLPNIGYERLNDIVYNEYRKIKRDDFSGEQEDVWREQARDLQGSNTDAIWETHSAGAGDYHQVIEDTTGALVAKGLSSWSFWEDVSPDDKRPSRGRLYTRGATNLIIVVAPGQEANDAIDVEIQKIKRDDFSEQEDTWREQARVLQTTGTMADHQFIGETSGSLFLSNEEARKAAADLDGEWYDYYETVQIIEDTTGALVAEGVSSWSFWEIDLGGLNHGDATNLIIVVAPDSDPTSKGSPAGYLKTISIPKNWRMLKALMGKRGLTVGEMEEMFAASGRKHWVIDRKTGERKEVPYGRTTISVEVQELVNAGVLVEGEKVKDKKTGRIAQSYQLDDE
ncbi:MAG: hypothetical protein GY861_00390, partial [bacterium]|nr:hypothetical protein [bacterium]